MLASGIGSRRARQVTARCLACLLVTVVATAAVPTLRADPVNGTWIQLRGPGGTKTIYDSVGDRMISIGDSSGAVWQLPFTGDPLWTGLDIAGEAPFPRSDAAVGYDRVHNRVYVFGGHDSNELWALHLAPTPSWELLHPTNPTGLRPAERNHASCLYDPIRNRLILYGGLYNDGIGQPGARSDVWEVTLSGTPAWRPLVTAGTTPPGRGLHGTIYDPIRDRMVIYAGQTVDSTVTSDVWALSLGGTPTWTQMVPSGGSPVARRGPVTIYDPIGDRMVMTCGTSAVSGSRKVWSLALSGAPAWTLMSAFDAQFDTWQGIYDSVRGRLVIRGATTWALTLSSQVWNQIPTPYDAPHVQYHRASYDATRHQMIVLGAEDGACSADRTWALSLGAVPAWRELTEADGAAGGQAQIYDPIRDRTLIFGGLACSPNTPRNQLLEYHDGDIAWSDIFCQGTLPPGTDGCAAIYDPVRDRMILYGGRNFSPSNPYPETMWTLPLSGTPTWSILEQGVSGRRDHAMVYDPVRDRLVIFGGLTANYTYLNDVWAFSLNGPPHWEMIAPAGPAPAPRARASAIYVPTLDAIVIFGGALSPFLGSHDVWMLSLSGTPAWTKLSPLGNSPKNTMESVAIYDPDRNRMVVFGSQLGGSGTWTLDWDAVVTAVMDQAKTEVTAERVRLVWAVEGVGLAKVERRQAGEAWREIAAVSGVTGRIAYEDREAAAGARYAYRLRATVAGRESLSPEVWVDVPARFELALAGVLWTGGPAALARITLPNDGAARIGVYDVSGRRLTSRDLGTLGRGSHALPLPEVQTMMSGVYLLRLEQAGRFTTAKIVIAR